MHKWRSSLLCGKPLSWVVLNVALHALSATPKPNPPAFIHCTENNTVVTLLVYSTHSLLYHLVLVAINAHFAVADNKGVDF